MPAPNTSEIIETEIDRVSTQYRESPKLLHVMRTYLRAAGQAFDALYDVPSFFDIDTANGEQLTFIGKRLGFVRCHCVCNVQPVFGFECEDVPSEYVLAGFCDDAITWVDCGPFGTSEICISDDEIYRAFLKVRRYQMLSLYNLASLTEAVRLFWGPQATVIESGLGRVVIAPGRALTVVESALLQLYPRVLPVAPGVRTYFHFGQLDVFGFGEGWGGFCEEWKPDGTPILTENGTPLMTENGLLIMTGPLTRDAPWMCEIDPMPYNCATV